MSRRPRSLALLPTLALVGALGLAGCSGGAGTSSQSAAPAASADSVASGSIARATSETDPATSPRRFLIATGTVALRSPDVAAARERVLGVVDRFHGEVAEQQSDTDGHGRLAHARLVVRIPSTDFRTGVAALERTADLVHSDAGADDVTTQVIDTRVDLRVQRRSVARVATLLDRARSIRDIVAIEAQLARRQARLGSLERRAAYLADQTAMSTVTVSVDRSPRSPAPVDRAGGFLAGLHAGWDGLTALAFVVATTAGAVLPFAVLLLVLLVPAWPLVRRLRRRHARAAAPTGG